MDKNLEEIKERIGQFINWLETVYAASEPMPNFETKAVIRAIEDMQDELQMYLDYDDDEKSTPYVDTDIQRDMKKDDDQ